MSATVPGAINTMAIALHKHHIDLVKYGSEHDSAFETVADQIGDMVKSEFPEVTQHWQLEMNLKSKSIEVGIQNPD